MVERIAHIADQIAPGRDVVAAAHIGRAVIGVFAAMRGIPFEIAGSVERQGMAAPIGLDRYARVQAGVEVAGRARRRKNIAVIGLVDPDRRLGDEAAHPHPGAIIVRPRPLHHRRPLGTNGGRSERIAGIGRNRLLEGLREGCARR